MSLDTLTWASYYVSKGWSVIPLVPRQKIPLLKEGEVHQYRKQLASHEQLRVWFENTDNNLGIITGTDTGPLVVDLDSAKGLEAFNILVNNHRYQTPLVKTGKGYHLYFKKSNTEIRNRARFITDCDIRGTGGYVVAPPSLNGTGKPYIWKRRPDKYELQPLPSQIASQIGGSGTNFQTRDSPFGLTEGLRDESLYSVAVSLHKGGLPRGAADNVLQELARSCNPPFSSEQALDKVRSAYENLPSERNISEEVREWVNDTNGVFQLRELFSTLRADKRGERNIRNCIKRLTDQRVLERVTGKNGFYRRVVNELVPIKYKEATSVAGFDLSFPGGFPFRDMFVLYPGNIVVVAGSPNAGKTALCLNLMVLNQHKYPVKYFSNEIYGAELRARLEQFEGRNVNKMTFEAFELNSNFHDQISQNTLNIVDYWQPGEEGAFYQIAEDLDKVHKKLNGTGLAVVCVQKKKGQELGRGAEFSSERPRLYLSMDFQRIKLVKVKSPVAGKNPHNREYKFTLVRGCEFIDVVEITDEKEE